jgi:hypothetical protein
MAFLAFVYSGIRMNSTDRTLALDISHLTGTYMGSHDDFS